MTEMMRNILDRFRTRRILVLGDLMLDEYLWGHIERISPEAPVPILSLARREQTLGGAGNVVKNLCSLGSQVAVLSVLGSDWTGDQILAELDSLGADRSRVIWQVDRKSSRKTRLMSLEHGQQVFRFDEETSERICADVEEKLLASVRRMVSDFHAVLCADYLKGTLTRRLLDACTAAARPQGIPVIIAPKGSDAEKYRGATVLIPNARELAQISGTHLDGGQWLRQAAEETLRRLDLHSLLVTQGGRGMTLFESNSGEIRQVRISAVARSVYDVTGAGDTAASVFTLAVAAGADHELAAKLANLASGIVVGKRGTAGVTLEEIAVALSAPEGDISNQPVSA